MREKSPGTRCGVRRSDVKSNSTAAPLRGKNTKPEIYPAEPTINLVPRTLLGPSGQRRERQGRRAYKRKTERAFGAADYLLVCVVVGPTKLIIIKSHSVCRGRICALCGPTRAPDANMTPPSFIMSY